MRILIMLRNRVYADYIGYHMKKLANEVKIVNKGQEVLPLLVSQHWDIAILGVSSFYNSLEILDLYNKHYKEKAQISGEEIPKKTKIYILSTFQDKGYMTNAILLGAAGYFRIPQKTNEFIDHIIRNDL